VTRPPNHHGLVQIHLLSIGYGTLDADAFRSHLRAGGVECVADIRRFAVNRQQPQFDAPAIAATLRGAGIDYRGMSELGDRRVPLPESPNHALRNAAWRGYADYMATAPFNEALIELLMLAEDRPTAVVCAESLWWRCHRRLLADAIVLVYGGAVTHLVGAMRAEHVLTPGVRRLGAQLRYDGRVERTM